MTQIPTKILMISARSDIGGGPKHLLDLTQGIKELYPEIDLTIAAPNEEPFANQFKEIANHFIAIPRRRFCPWTYLKLLIFCKERGVQLVHSHGRGAGMYSRLLGLFGVFVVHTFHGAHAEKTIIGRLKLMIDRVLRPLTSKFICVSQDECQKVIQLKMAPGKEEISTVFNGVDIKSIQSQFANSFRNTHQGVVLGTLARLHFQKGLDLLLQAVFENSDFLKKNSIYIKIAGAGEEETKLKELSKSFNIEELVEFAGETREPISFLSKLDGYISFARWEGMPLSVLEAMAAGLPCLLSRITGHMDLSNGGSALLFNPESPIEFRNVLEKFLDKQFRQELAAKGKHRAEIAFSRERMVVETLDVYRHL